MKRFFYFLVLVVFSYSAIAQSKKDLQNEYKQLQNEIKNLEKNLKQRTKEKSIGLKEIETINQKIETRKKMVENTYKQLVSIEKELEVKKIEFDKIKEDQEIYKKEYIKLIRWQYKNRETNYIDKLAFVFQADNFMGIWSRIKYIKKYSDYAKKQANILENISKRIKSRVIELKNTQAEKSNIIESNLQNQAKLEIEKQKRDEMISQISKEVEKIKSSLAEKNKAAADINNKIKKLIEEAIRKQKEADLAKAKAKQELQKKEGNTESQKTVAEIYAESHNTILSNSFQSNKGNLPLPVKSGVVVGRFGRQPHPLAPELMIENNGIDIKTSNNAEVICMYEGKVVQIFDMPNYETSVLVKHGDYFTLYSHLSSVSVSVGADINARQSIGRAAYSSDHGFAFTHIQIWHYNTKQNPSAWIKGI